MPGIDKNWEDEIWGSHGSYNKLTVFLDVTPYSLVDRYQHFKREIKYKSTLRRQNTPNWNGKQTTIAATKVTELINLF
jgi:hypothetical protein